MIVVKKKMKKPLLIAILAAALAVLILAGVLINTLLLADDGGDDTDSSAGSTVEIMTELGESTYAGVPIAYSAVDDDDMRFIAVQSEQYDYSFYRPTDSKGEIESYFMLSYVDGNGELQKYYPPILGEDATFEYEDMYAKEQNDGYGTIYKLTYLCTAIGTLYFNERIKVADDETERDEDLKTYGLSSEDETIRVYFNYIDGDGEEQSHYVTIGEKLISGSGYYFTVDDRPYVYTTYSTYLDYAFLGFADFINPILVAEGLAQDNAFEPYLTTGYSQWTNTLYHPYRDDEGNWVHYTVQDGSKVIVSAAVSGSSPSAEDDTGSYIELLGGYKQDGVSDRTFDLSSIAKNSSYEKFVAALVGKSTGALDNTVLVTVPSYSNPVTLGSTYSYEILAIESVIEDNVELTEQGTAVNEGDLVKIRYRVTANGAEPSVFFGVIDLSEESLIDAEVKNALCGMSVGELDTPYSFELVYSESNSVYRNVQMAITEIIEIVSEDDSSEVLDKVAVGTKVAVRLYYIVDGKRSEEPESFFLPIEENMTGVSKEIADALMGLTAGELDEEIIINEYSAYCEAVAGYTCYEISEIKYFVTKEEIVSFRFEQASERDPYYGESLYTNTTGGSYSMYALDSTACESVVAILGGLLTSANKSTGLVGNKTVDVVITPEKLLKYGLYDYTVYFELPRGITEIEYDGITEINSYLSDLDDYSYYSTLGFTLYISKEDPVSGTRYIASDLYDVIAEIDSENFAFLEQNFLDYYARKNMILVDINNIENIEIEFSMDDVSGIYNNDLVHLERYVYNGTPYTKADLIERFGEEALSVSSIVNLIDVDVSAEGDTVQTALSEYLAQNGKTHVTLRELYGGKTVDGDSLGTSMFKEFIESLFYTYYQGALSEDEKNEGIANGSLLMKMTVTLYEGYSAYDYVYEYYRISDRRVMVRLYKENRTNGNIKQDSDVYDFYISTFAFKKIVNIYFGLLNAQEIDNEVAYPDGSILN